MNDRTFSSTEQQFLTCNEQQHCHRAHRHRALASRTAGMMWASRARRSRAMTYSEIG